MWFIQPKHDYTREMPWDYKDEPAQLMWQIRARAYRTDIANYALIFMVIFGFLMGVGLNAAGSGIPVWAPPMFGTVMSALLGMSMTHQTAIIVYRVTEHHVEFFSWKPQIDMIAPLMKWTAAILAIPVAIIILLDPGTVLAAAGPLGLALTGYMMGTSKRNQAMYREEIHLYFPIKDVHEIVTITKRRIINLKANEAPGTYIPLFCNRDNYDDVFQFFKHKTAVDPIERRVIISNAGDAYTTDEDHPDSPDLRPPRKRPKH